MKTFPRFRKLGTNAQHPYGFKSPFGRYGTKTSLREPGWEKKG